MSSAGDVDLPPVARDPSTSYRHQRPSIVPRVAKLSSAKVTASKSRAAKPKRRPSKKRSAAATAARGRVAAVKARGRPAPAQDTTTVAEPPSPSADSGPPPAGPDENGPSSEDGARQAGLAGQRETQAHEFGLPMSPVPAEATQSTIISLEEDVGLDLASVVALARDVAETRAELRSMRAQLAAAVADASAARRESQAASRATSDLGAHVDKLYDQVRKRSETEGVHAAELASVRRGLDDVKESAERLEALQTARSSRNHGDAADTRRKLEELSSFIEEAKRSKVESGHRSEERWTELKRLHAGLERRVSAIEAVAGIGSSDDAIRLRGCAAVDLAAVRGDMAANFASLQLRCTTLEEGLRESRSVAHRMELLTDDISRRIADDKEWMRRRIENACSDLQGCVERLVSMPPGGYICDKVEPSAKPVTTDTMPLLNDVERRVSALSDNQARLKSSAETATQLAQRAFDRSRELERLVSAQSEALEIALTAALAETQRQARRSTEEHEGMSRPDRRFESESDRRESGRPPRVRAQVSAEADASVGGRPAKGIAFTSLSGPTRGSDQLSGSSAVHQRLFTTASGELVTTTVPRRAPPPKPGVDSQEPRPTSADATTADDAGEGYKRAWEAENFSLLPSPASPPPPPRPRLEGASRAGKAPSPSADSA